MRKLCQSAVQPRCVHTGQPFHAGRAVFRVFQTRNFAASLRRPDEKKQPVIRWYEQTGNDKRNVRLVPDDLSESDLQGLAEEEESLRQLQREVARLEKGEEIDFEDDLEFSGVEDGQDDVDKYEASMHKQLAELDEELKQLRFEEDSLDNDQQDGGESALSTEEDVSSEPSELAGEADELRDFEAELGGLSKDLQKLTDLTASEDSTQAASAKPAGAPGESTQLDFKFLSGDSSNDLSSLELEFKLPRVLKLRIKEFNDSIKMVATNLSHVYHRRNLWVAYMRCKRTVPGFLEQLSDLAWKVLWQSQSAEPFFDEQAPHLLMLAEDMRTSGKPLSSAQKLLCIKASEADGDFQKALTMWQQMRKELQKDPSLRYEFNALGVALECAMKKPERAEALALSVVAASTKTSGSARLLIPVIAAWARQDSDESVRRAWGLYLLLRQSLISQTKKEHRMTAEDHDQIFLAFLEAGHRKLALSVFKDLIVAGQNSHYDSVSLARSMGFALDSLHSSESMPDKLNEVSLEALTRLPRRFENKYFYASWMKRLIGMGRVDAASQVMELMYQRGVPPDAKHTNGIVSAWLRFGNQHEQNQALDLAWSMVRERLRLLQQRRDQPSRSPREVQNEEIEGIVLPKHMQRQAPIATTETFCLLLLYYSSKGNPLVIEQIRQLLSAAELHPNSYFMNHLMQAYANQNKPIESWTLFTGMSKDVEPDMATFSCLWNVAGRLTSIYEQMDRFPGPRRLFSTMMDWLSQLRPKTKASAAEDFDAATYNQIIRAFCQWKDLNGTLVAMYALRDAFGYYPDDEAMKLVTLQIAQLNERRQAPHPLGRSRTRRRKRSANDASRMESAAKALEMLLENRKAELAAQGTKLEDLDEQERGEERLHIAGELLRAADRSYSSSDSIFETQELSEKFDQVAWEMGSGPFKTGPPVYNNKTHDASGLIVY